jgi:hypothetical protein
MAKQQAMLRASQYYWVDFKKVLVHPPSSRMLSLGHLCDELTGGQFFFATSPISLLQLHKTIQRAGCARPNGPLIFNL